MPTYKIDPSHSDISFKVKHLMISTASGSFKKFDATLEAEKEDFTDAKITFEADTDSIDTGNEQRDGHLKSDDFFNAEQYPKVTFTSTGIEKLSPEEYKLKGDLTIRDVTKPVELKVEYNGNITDPWGNERVGFELTGKVNRKDFGLKWGAVTEAGGIVLGDEVKLHMNIELIKQA